jgi:hypothetical protein
LTLPEFLDNTGHIVETAKEEFQLKLNIYNEWVDKSQELGFYMEDLVKHAFLDAGYSVQKVTFQTPADLLNPEGGHVEIDALCVKERWHLGVQVKNVTSEVFIDPDKIGRKTEIYKRLEKQFQFCSRNELTPILFSPFIDGSFYCFDDQHKGLHCQTFLQLFNPENGELCRNVKEVLKFGNVRVVEELPPNTRSWIDRIPQMYRDRERIRANRADVIDQPDV